MRGSSPRLLLLGLAALAAPAVASDPLEDLERAQRELFARAAPSVLFISTPQGFGSGFFVNATGLALTNAHVVGKKDLVDVVLNDGRKLTGKVVERAPEDLDLALVQVPVPSSAPLPLAGAGDLAVGSWVASIGHGLGGIWTFTTGMVSNIYPDRGERPVFQTQIPLNPGNSGGPVLDRRGRVVGVVTAGIRASNSINFAIRSDVATRKLAGLRSSCECLVILAPPEVPVFVDGEMAGKGPRVTVPAQARAYEVFAVVSGQMRKRTATYPAEREVDLTRAQAPVAGPAQP